jgi:hypothetical protein
MGVCRAQVEAWIDIKDICMMCKNDITAGHLVSSRDIIGDFPDYLRDKSGPPRLENNPFETIAIHEGPSGVVNIREQEEIFRQIQEANQR